MTAPKVRHHPRWADELTGRWGCVCGHVGRMVMVQTGGVEGAYSLAAAQRQHEEQEARRCTLEDGQRAACGHLVAVGRHAYWLDLNGDLVCGRCW